VSEAYAFSSYDHLLFLMATPSSKTLMTNLKLKK